MCHEHWCPSDNISKFNKFSNYHSFGISAINNTIQNGVMYGRPFGGTLTMINKSISMHTVQLLLKERIVILSINNFIIINAYLPCKDNSEETRDILLEILADISSTIDDLKYDGIIFGGDFNCNLCNNSEQSLIVKNFLKMYNMEYIDITKSNSKDVYTFSNVAKGCYSRIDYICVSDSLIPFIIKYDVVHSPYNFSDHEPVEIVL